MTTTEIAPAKAATETAQAPVRRVRADLLVTAGILAALVVARLLPGLI